MKYPLAVVAACVGTSAIAQTAPSFPTKAERTDFRYFTVETITAKPNARLWKIVNEHFRPAARDAGVPFPIVYHAETGVPRTIMISPLSGGPGDMAWEMSPEDVKFMAALAKREGGQDKAMALWKEYNDGIESRTRDLVHEHVK